MIRTVSNAGFFNFIVFICLANSLNYVLGNRKKELFALTNLNNQKELGFHFSSKNWHISFNIPDKALIHYEYALERSPERFKSLRGAAIAAEKVNKKDIAQKYKNKIANLTKNAQIPVPKWGVALN